MLLAIILLISLSYGHTSSMNVPSVLLPYPTKQHSIDYTIEATNGCFQWSTSNPTVSTLYPIGGKCSTQCKISVQPTTKKGRQSFWVYAVDELQHVNLRTEVTIDSIDRIDVVTTTRLMNKDDYEVLEIAGYDAIGNKFSTLEGIPVTWSIDSVNGTKGNGGDYVRIEKFSTAGHTLKLKASETILDMERYHLSTSKVLVKGLELGKAQMTAQLTEEPTKVSSVILTVLQILVVLPEKDLYVLPNTQIPYQVFTTKRNELGPQIVMPNPNYKWVSYNEGIVSIQQNGLASAYKNGKAVISVMYIETPESIQKRTINVVSPYKVRLVWKEIRGVWQWIEGKTYEVKPELVDSHGNAISYVSNAEYKITLNGGIKIISNEPGYTSFIVATEKEGRASISASFVKGNGFSVRGNSVYCIQDIIISQQVIASPKKLKLAVPGTAGCKIIAHGGHGEYVYSVNGESVAVTNDGVVFPRSAGKVNVTVSDSRNSENFDIVIVEASEVASIEIGNDVAEVIVGGTLNFTALARDTDGIYFDTCSSAAVNWKVMQPEIFQLKTNSTSQKAEILASKSGSTTLVATYGKGIAEVQVFAYEKLQLSYKSSRDPHIVKASGFKISYEGGPLPWYLNKGLYFTNITLRNRIADVYNMGNNQLFFVCKEYGKSMVMITVGNKVGKTHNYTVHTSAKMEFTCSEPSVLMLTTQEVYESDNAGKEIVTNNVPGICRERAVSGSDSVTSEMTVRVGEELDLIGYVKPSVTGMFTNSSSVEYVWSTSDRHMLSISRQINKEDHSSIHVSVGDSIGKVELRLTAIKYQKKYFNNARMSGKLDINNNLIRTITLNVVDVVSVSPKVVTLFNHPDNFVKLIASSGSGFYNFTTDTPNNVMIEHYGTDSSCIVRPRNESNTYIVANDVCFNGKNDEARVVVTVSDIHGVNIIVTDQIEIGETSELTFEAIDVNGQPFDESQYKFMDIKVTTDNSNVFLEKKGIKKYSITGSTVGMAMIVVTINNVQSKPSSVIIYEHFSCTPKEINLIPLAQEDIKCRGGPPLRSTVSHVILSGNAVQLNGDKVIGEIKGRSVIESRISFIELLSGEKREKGKENCEVIVRHLTGLRMDAHQTTLEVGGQTKIRVIGEADGVPVSIAATQLDFSWSQSDDIPLEILSVYHKTNITANEEMSHTVLLMAKKAGQTRVNVKIVNIQKGLPSAYKQLSASILIHVVDPFSSLCAGRCRNVIDMAVHSTTQIITNREPSEVTFQICEGSDIITVDAAGIVKSHGTPGSAVVHVVESETGETLSYVVKVHRIHAIELLPLYSSNGLSVGETMKFEMIPIGDRGRVLKPSYDKLVQFDLIPSGSASIIQSSNLSIVEVTAAKPGRVIVRVRSSEGVRLQDEVRVTVHHSVSPINPVVTVGSEIRFKTAGEAKWTTESRNIISIDSNGRAIAKSIGRTVVMTTSSTPAQTRVSVSPLESASLEPATVGSGRVLIPVTLYAEAGMVTQQSNVDLNLNAYCSIDQSTWAHASVEVVYGKIYCSVVAVPTTSGKVPNQVKLRFNAKDGFGKAVQAVAVLPFRAGIVAKPGNLKIKTGEEANLDIFRAKGDVIVRDLTGKLQIREVTRSDGSASFVVRGMENVKGDIEILDGTETLKVFVEVGEIKERKLGRTSANALGPIVIAILSIILASLVFFLCQRRTDNGPAQYNPGYGYYNPQQQYRY
ncbi:nuclear pore protein, putative [Entamoeba histolytica HM-1:IMSS-B]|uniref:Nuclear pore protein, putative n=6 Tax=Entamoeba histolytica TaxID=5759 RepID=C4M730_ENTH1|nr:nuclear pore protein, putative [Entamoeba histolytica HM-1:IMSS]EMD49663.1 nuclear pore protein, putative [Entamoeba histolytica KU27]EMH75279.1 nuclear pore protein, putative [Entamoeba histolytica HM-1:IMSS-B]ENY66031.1 nuclear pore protein, putative [Entamoeba histolytica HM-1:IMSS-A]GAT97322.1 nuclear pore protein putative [Entamoeba histolytica]EAL48939.1 nuclear pore protein, putative [Entamoeba histolytica HM-1:IMSS]|eukprot:XP_654325.1 nuclear pore protein, putative [Entamoeba histolytica HM-1:IMSS]